eukprot:g66601.t1
MLVWFLLSISACIVLYSIGTKKVILFILGLFQKLSVFLLSLRGMTPQDEIEKRVTTGQSWEEFCDTLKAAGTAMLYPGAPKDAFNQAEGYRYLSRLVRAGLENFIECADPLNPRLVAIANGDRDCPVHIGSDNPDNLYQNAVIDGRHTYRVWGTRGSVYYLGFGTQKGQYGKVGGFETVDYIEAVDLKYKNDGQAVSPAAREFELFLGPERPPGAVNWLKTATDPSHGMFILRQTFLDKKTEVAAKVQIELVQGAEPNRTWTAEHLDTGLKNASLLVTGASLMFAEWARGFQKHVNQLPLFDQQKSNKLPLFDQQKSNKAGGDPNIRYYHSYYHLKEDEVLVIEAEVPRAKLQSTGGMWNFQLNNHWMESLDYRYDAVWCNSHSASYREDGSVRILVSPRPVPPRSTTAGETWLTTVGHLQGAMCFRWVRPGVSDDQLPHPTPLKKAGTLRTLKDVKNEVQNGHAEKNFIEKGTELTENSKDPLVASKTPTSEGVAELLKDHVDANALRNEAYNIKKQINRKKVALIKARKKLEKVIRLNAKGRNKPDGGAASTWTAEGTKIKLDPDEGQQIWKSAFEIRREEKEKEDAAEAVRHCMRPNVRKSSRRWMDTKTSYPKIRTRSMLPMNTFDNGHTHVPGRKKRRQLKNLHHPGAIKMLMPVAAAALAVKKQEKNEYVIVSDSDDDDEGSRNMPKLLAPQARAAAARQAWLTEVDNIEHELDRINEQFESYKKQKHIGNTTVGTATATTTTAVAQPSVPVKNRSEETGGRAIEHARLRHINSDAARIVRRSSSFE